MASSGRSARADSEDDVRYRKALTGSTKSDSSAGQLSSKHGILPIYDSTDSLDSRQSFTAMRLRHRSSLFDGTTRFPKLTECAHFHYDFVELADVKVCIGEDLDENYQHKNGEHTEPPENHFTLQVTSASKTWSIRRTYDNFRQLDRQLHKCIYDRKFSHLPELQREWGQARNNGEFLHGLLSQYLGRLSDIAGSMINCGPILNWFELDNRGNHLLAVDDSGINTPAIAAAHAVKRYTAQAADEISLEVGDIVSVIDMPPPEDTIWWRGKRGFEVGFFPSGCVEVIGDKVPQSMASRIPEPPQKAVLRKHGKLITFFRTFFSNRPTRNELKQSGIVKERVFSCDLGEHLLNSGHDVPLVLKCCADVIENHGIVDGIYRLSGIASNIQKLRLAFDEDRAPDLTSETYLQDIHSISSLLKMYFRELPNPLLTYQLYDKFAEAVRDEDNKLLKIHDVVQQLPPPHYRTTQYLMRHLARVAANGHLTGMHSKNLAIVWAPNLLRSKELEIGGGAAALQGVGIQAVVTEFLICYADLIFSDRIPAYSSPDTNRSQKKPRPKSLAISTPTRLLSLEEARERALTTAIHPPQKFIDVGGGPENLPAKYHTVLDLPGYKKKLKDNKEPVKQKKSPVGGWKSFFSKSRSSSLKVGKGRKSSVPDPLTLGEQKAITEEDVHNWKRRRLRTAKSVESLTSSRGSRFFEFGSFDLSSPGPGSTGVIHKRGSSSSRSRSQSLDRNMFGSCSSRETVKEMAIDIGPSPRHGSTKQGHDKENTSPNQCPLEKKTSFIRGDSTRRAVFHRKTASAPSNQIQLEDSPPPPEAKRSTQPFESSSVRRKKSEKNKGPVESHLEISVPVGEVTITRELADKFVLRVDSKEIFRPPDQFDKPPDGRSSLRGDKKGKGKKKSKGDKLREGETVCTVDLQESPSARRKLSEESHGSPTRRDQVMETDDKPYFSRFHDYAEILEDQQEIDKHEARIRDELKAVGQGETSADVSLEPSQTLSEAVLNVTENDSSREHSDSSVDQLMYDVSQFEQSFHEPPAEYSNPRMSKSLSIPSDIQRSLDNVNLDSQSDLMSSVTISELSQSVDSFNVGLSDSEGEGSLWRSTSLGGDQESPLGRTLREINAQIDKAFQSDPSTPNEQLYMYPVDENLCFTIPDVPTVDTTSMLQQSVFEDYEEEEVATPTNESHFDFESVTKAPDSVPRSTFSTVSPATVSLADSTHKPHLSTVEVPSKTSLHQTAGVQDYREATIQGPPPAVGHDSNPLRPLPDVCLSYNQVKAPEADKSTVSSLEMAKRQLDADFVEIDPRMRESQLTEGEYVQLEDEDYVRLQQDARLTDEPVNKTSKSRQNGSAKTVHKSDSAQSSSSMETIDTHVSGSPSVDLSLPLSASDEKFWQNTEFPALSPLSEVIEAYCCNLKTEGKACEIHDKCQSSGSSEQVSPEGFPEFDTTLRIDESVEELHIETDPIVSGVVCGQHSPAMVQIQLPSDTPSGPAEVEDETEPDVQVSYQIDFRKSGGFDILPEETPSYQEISTECFIVSPPETPVLELPPSLTNSVEMQPTLLQSERGLVVEERKQIQKPCANDTCGENIDKQTSSNVSTPVSVEDWYSQMLQHGLRQTPDSDMDKLETVLMNQKDVSEPSSGSGKRPYDTMVEEQKYVDSLVAQLALGLPAAPTDANTSPVKKLKDGSHEDVGQTPKDLHLPPHVDMIPGEFRSQFNKSPKEHIRQSSGPRNKQIAPPKHDELITVRQKVTKLKKSPKSPPSVDGLGSSEIISVQEVSSDLGNAKLIVERRAIDKKKVQTVHATKVEQPLKQHAESLDSLSVVGGGQGELKCSKSHESLGVRSRDRTDLPQRMTNSACEPLSGCLDLTSPDTMSTSLTSSTDTFVSGMTDSADFSDFYMGQHSDGQALSLTGSGYLVKPTAEDAFLVQKAASLPNVGSWSPPLDGQTHSLPRSSASSRSSKLQSLKELFEPSSLENASGIVKSESQSGRPSPQCVPAESYDHSSTRQSRGQSPRVTFKDSPPRSQEFDPVNWQVSGLCETQDQNFPPDTTGLRKPKWTHQEQDGVLADCSEQGVEFTRNRVRISDPPISPSGKPPIHRHSNIRSRTHSDSALEDTNTSDLELCAEFTGDLSTGSLDRDHSKKSNLQRKGSIRELVAVFEKQGDSGLSSDSRTDSRGSLPAELTASREGLDQGVSSSGKSREFSPAPREPSRGRSPGPTDFSRAQSVRLGPKPFYGSK